MQLTHPMLITARLMPGVKIGKAYISIGYHGVTDDGRTLYLYHIDAKEFEYTGKDLKSGVGGGHLHGGMESLLYFLSACAESYRYAKGKGENSDLFPKHVAEWAMQNEDEISMTLLEMEENKNACIE